jgi:hypothetical protein
MPDHRALPDAAELEKAAAAEYPNQIKLMSSRQRFSREARKGALVQGGRDERVARRLGGPVERLSLPSRGLVSALHAEQTQ